MKLPNLVILSIFLSASSFAADVAPEVVKQTLVGRGKSQAVITCTIRSSTITHTLTKTIYDPTKPAGSAHLGGEVIPFDSDIRNVTIFNNLVSTASPGQRTVGHRDHTDRSYAYTAVPYHAHKGTVMKNTMPGQALKEVGSESVKLINFMDKNCE